MVDRILAAARAVRRVLPGLALMTLQVPEQLGPFWELLSGYHGERHPGPSFAPVTRAPLVVVPLSSKDAYLDRYARQDKGRTDRDEAPGRCPTGTSTPGLPPS